MASHHDDVAFMREMKAGWLYKGLQTPLGPKPAFSVTLNEMFLGPGLRCYGILGILGSLGHSMSSFTESRL